MKNLVRILDESWLRIYDIGTRVSAKYTQMVHWDDPELEEELYIKKTWAE